MNATKIATRIGAVMAAAAVAVTAGGAPSAQATSQTTGRVTATSGLSERSAPTTHSTKTGAYNRGAKLTLHCSTPGTSVAGKRTWYSTNAAGTHWVAAAYVSVNGSVQECPTYDTGKSEGVTLVRLNLRAGPSTSDRILDWYPHSSGVSAICKVRAQSVAGNTLWYLIENESWVSARYIKNVNGGPGSNSTPVWCK